MKLKLPTHGHSTEDYLKHSENIARILAGVAAHGSQTYPTTEIHALIDCYLKKTQAPSEKD